LTSGVNLGKVRAMARASKLLLFTGALLVAIQLVRCEHDNPPVTGEIQAPANVQAILERACYDCHSNETRWPWYSHVAPVSWLVHHDVEEGREHLNFSEWTQLAADKQAHAREEIQELTIDKSDMPLAYYVLLHSNARLSDADRQALKAWLSAAK
jgi:hypothetical protein